MDTTTVANTIATPCIVCGELIEQMRAGAGRPRLICSAACKRARATQLHGTGYDRVDLPPRPCEHCGEDYKPKSKAAKFCCVPCRRASHKGREIRWTHACSGCGKSFQGRRLQTFCTQACSAKHNGRHGGRPSADGTPPRRPSRPGVPTAQRSSFRHLLGDPCSYCGGPTDSVDHIEPASRGGDDHWSNYTASCKPCNTSKMTSPLLAFLLRRRVDAEIAVLREEREVLLNL